MDITEQNHSTCEGNCLTINCPVFRKGQYCGPECHCPNCHNRPEYENERNEMFKKILLENPLAFTGEYPLSPEEFTSISNFAILTNSVDTEPFKLVEEEKPLSKVLVPKINSLMELSIATIFSAANEALKNSKDKNTYEEEVENSIVSEFQNIIVQISNSVEQ
jgi:hypothetical protein